MVHRLRSEARSSSRSCMFFALAEVVSTTDSSAAEPPEPGAPGGQVSACGSSLPS
jgi:hypothetical protein